VRLPAEYLSVSSRYLDKLNFATNFAFFREADGMSTRLVSANYWAGYGATNIRLWLRLFGIDGKSLADWEHPLPRGAGGFTICNGAGVTIGGSPTASGGNTPYHYSWSGGSAGVANPTVNPAVCRL
jgi:hypothetical protein